MSDNQAWAQLRLAIDPYGEHPNDDLEMLIWRAGRMREHIESAHHWLDMRGAPRKLFDGPLTLRGRMDALDTAAECLPVRNVD